MIGLDTSFLVAWEMDEHPLHAHCRARMTELAAAGNDFALTSIVIAEFCHVVTDAKRFLTPLEMSTALDRIAFWRDAREVVFVHPGLDDIKTFELWMRTHHLGRKRLLDTMLAAVFRGCGVTRVLTLNKADFSLFDCFDFPLEPTPTPP